MKKTWNPLELLKHAKKWQFALHIIFIADVRKYGLKQN